MSIKEQSQPDSKPHIAIWLFVAIILLYLSGALFPTYYTWGFNYWGLFSLQLTIVLLVATLIALLPPVNRWLTAFLVRFTTPIFTLVDKINPFVAKIFGSILIGLFFYIFRSRALVYGDGFMVLDSYTNLQAPFDFSLYFMKPLVVPFHRVSYSLLSKFITAPPENVIAIINVVGGVIGFWALYRISRMLANNSPARWSILAGAMTSGAVILFFGYIENYTWATALSLWSLAYSIGYVKGVNGRLRGLLAAIIACGFHLFAIPFLVVALLAALTKPNKSGALPLGLSFKQVRWGMVIVSVVAAFLFQVSSLPRYLLQFWPVQDNQYWFLSVKHLLDMFNESLLVAPIGTIVVIFTLCRFRKNREPRSLEEELLVSTALLAFLASFWINPNLGAPRDWDLLSFYGFPLSLWGVYKLSHWVPDLFTRNRALISILVIWSISIIPNLVEKNDLSAAATHLDDMLQQDVHYQVGYMQGERCLPWGYTLRIAGCPDRSMKYFRRRLAAQEDDYQAWFNLGEIYLSMNRNDSAYSCLSRAVNIERNDFQLLSKLVRVESALGMNKAALKHAERAVQLDPTDVIIQTQLAVLLFQAEKNRKALEHFHKAYKLAPNSCEFAVNLGLMFNALQMHDSAYYYLNIGTTLPGVVSIKAMAYRAMVENALAMGKYDKAERALKMVERLARIIHEKSRRSLLILYHLAD